MALMVTTYPKGPTCCGNGMAVISFSFTSVAIEPTPGEFQLPTYTPDEASFYSLPDHECANLSFHLVRSLCDGANPLHYT